MTSTMPRPATARDFVQPLGAWLRPIVFAALLDRIVTTATFPILYSAYRHFVPTAWALQFSVRSSLHTLVSIRALAYALAWATAFVLLYRGWAPVRREVERRHGVLVVGGFFGCGLYLVMHYVVSFSSRHILSISFVNWLTFVLVTGPIIVWSTHRFRPLSGATAAESMYAVPSAAEQRPSAAERDAERERGLREIFASMFFLVPSAICLLWLFTDPQTGDLMIIWFFIFLAALFVAVIGLGLLLGGIWTMRGLRGRWVARLAPALIAGAVVLALFSR